MEGLLDEDEVLEESGRSLGPRGIPPKAPGRGATARVIFVAVER